MIPRRARGGAQPDHRSGTAPDAGPIALPLAVPESTSAEAMEKYLGGKPVAVGRGDAWWDLNAWIIAPSPTTGTMRLPAVSEPFLAWTTSGEVDFHEREIGGTWVTNRFRRGSFFLTFGGAPYDVRWNAVESKPGATEARPRVRRHRRRVRARRRGDRPHPGPDQGDRRRFSARMRGDARVNDGQFAPRAPAATWATCGFDLLLRRKVNEVGQIAAYGSGTAMQADVGEEQLVTLELHSMRHTHLGASAMWARQFLKALHVAESRGWTRFVAMQDHLNLMYREEEREMLPLCQEEKIGVIPYSPLRVHSTGEYRPGCPAEVRRRG